MVREFALLPDLFTAPPYALKYTSAFFNSLFCKSLVRNMHNGFWEEYLKNSFKHNLQAKHFIKDLSKNHLLRNFKACIPHKPKTMKDWINEALASDKLDPLSAVICMNQNTAQGNSIKCLNDPTFAGWLLENSDNTGFISSNFSSFVKSFEKLLTHCRRFVFVDRYFDINRPSYKGFYKIIRKALKNERIIVEIVTSDKILGDKGDIRKWPFKKLAFKEYFDNHFSDRIQMNSLSIRIVLHSHANIHARFFIADSFCFNIEWGFQEKPQKTLISQLNRNTTDEINRTLLNPNNIQPLKVYSIP